MFYPINYWNTNVRNPFTDMTNIYFYFVHTKYYFALMNYYFVFSKYYFVLANYYFVFSEYYFVLTNYYFVFSKYNFGTGSQNFSVNNRFIKTYFTSI